MIEQHFMKHTLTSKGVLKSKNSVPALSLLLMSAGFIFSLHAQNRVTISDAPLKFKFIECTKDDCKSQNGSAVLEGTDGMEYYYIGTWSDSLPDGKGEIVSPLREWSYKGSFVKGVAEGECQINDGAFHFQGECKYASAVKGRASNPNWEKMYGKSFRRIAVVDGKLKLSKIQQERMKIVDSNKKKKSDSKLPHKESLNEQDTLQEGGELFASFCATCHDNTKTAPDFFRRKGIRPYSKDEYKNIILHGITDPKDMKMKPATGQCPSHEYLLTSKEIEYLLNYIDWKMQNLNINNPSP